MAGRKSRVPKWPEVKGTNYYATLLGCLAMVVRGLGFLVFTWTTVVLLGGFVSLLQKKDFWSLTVITFIQIAGVIGNTQDDKWSSAAMSVLGLNALGVPFASYRRMLSGGFWRRPPGVVVLGKKSLGLIQQATYVIVFSCSAIGIFLGGPYIAMGISLWRLKQHDYGNVDGDSSKANMNPALDVLYIIVVVQGAILIYRRILNAFVTKKVVAEVAKAYGFKGRSVALIQVYTKETLKGCAKNPSFTKGRNLVTYAVDLMGPDKSPQDYVSGLKILSTILGPLRHGRPEAFKEQRTLIRQLILYAPSSHIFRHLLVLLDARNRPNNREIREESEIRELRKHVANIVAHMADEASQEQLPQVIQCMSSMIGTFEEYQQFFSSNSTDHDSDYAEDYYLDQLGEAMHVLFLLAANENNCRLIIHTRGLLTKIMTPLVSDLYHQANHDAWGDVVVESLKLLHRLTATYGHREGETRAKLFREIETNLEVEVVEALMRILRCNECSQKMETLIMGIATDLNMKQIQMHTANREEFIEKLAYIYTSPFANSTRIAALEALAELCFKDGSNATTILQVNGSAVYSFTDDLDALSDGYQRHHISVADILEHACLHYTRDDECLEILKKSMIDVMPKVLNKILASQTGPQGGPLQDNGQNRSSSYLQEIQEQHDIRKIETALLSLCVRVHKTFISADQYLALQFDGAIGAFNLPVKLREMVERNTNPTASCLKILKLTCSMVISMMKCRGSRYPKQDLESLVEELSKACSRKMHIIDSSMGFVRGDDAAKPRNPERTLASFVAEAMELVRNYGEPEVMAPSIIVCGELSSN